MAIIFVTGIPGHGKTLWTLARLKPLAESEQRPVFHSHKDATTGIPGLTIPDWQPLDPMKWFDVPANSYVVMDECQKVFPVRARAAAVPKHVEELETHRHGGIDLYLITQHPGLVDTNVRHLVDRHFHVVRSFGTKNATVYEFPVGVQVDPFKNRKRAGVIEHKWRFPKKVFGWYKSAEVHTVKARIPMRFWLLCALFVIVPLLVWYAWTRVNPHRAQVASSAAASSAAVGVSGVPARVSVRQADVQSTASYLASMRPRIAGLAFTAPAYDGLTKPVEAPYPSVCAYSRDFPCRCWSQRGFKLEVPKPMCEQLAREPMDPYWLRRGPLGFERGQAGEVAAASAPAVGQPPVQPVVQASAQ